MGYNLCSLFEDVMQRTDIFVGFFRLREFNLISWNSNSNNIMGDKLLLNFGAKFQR